MTMWLKQLNNTGRILIAANSGQSTLEDGRRSFQRSSASVAPNLNLIPSSIGYVIRFERWSYRRRRRRCRIDRIRPSTFFFFFDICRICRWNHNADAMNCRKLKKKKQKEKTVADWTEIGLPSTINKWMNSIGFVSRAKLDASPWNLICFEQWRRQIDYSGLPRAIDAAGLNRILPTAGIFNHFVCEWVLNPVPRSYFLFPVSISRRCFKLGQ